MTDRRRTPRYVLQTPLRADAMPMEDVTVEQLSGRRVVVISPSAPERDEELMIHMRTAEGMQSRRATVIVSTPVTVGGALRFRVELLVEDQPALPQEVSGETIP